MHILGPQCFGWVFCELSTNVALNLLVEITILLHVDHHADHEVAPLCVRVEDVDLLLPLGRLVRKTSGLHYEAIKAWDGGLYPPNDFWVLYLEIRICTDHLLDTLAILQPCWQVRVIGGDS